MPSGVMESHGDNVETSEKTETVLPVAFFSKESTGSKSREKKRKKQKKQKTSDAKVTTATTATSGFGDPALIKSLSLEVARPSVHRQVQRTVRGAA